jgi:hypothetical protein
MHSATDITVARTRTHHARTQVLERDHHISDLSDKAGASMPCYAVLSQLLTRCFCMFRFKMDEHTANFRQCGCGSIAPNSRSTAEWSHVPVACIYSIRMPRAPLFCKYIYGVLADCLAVLVWANVRTMTAECLSDVGPH